MHGRCRVSLRIFQNSAVLESDITGVPAVFITKNGHQACFSRLAKSGGYRLKVNWQVGIPIHNEKLIAQKRKRFTHCTTGSDKTRAIIRILQRHTEAFAIAERCVYFFSQMPNAQHDSFNSLVSQER